LRSAEGLGKFQRQAREAWGGTQLECPLYEKDFSDSSKRSLPTLPRGTFEAIHPQPGQWSYKKSPIQPEEPGQAGSSRATLKLFSGKAEHIAGIMRSRKLDRMAKGHYRMPSAGSVFKNNRSFGKPTGLILDGLGMKGAKIGGAAISPWHANIFINEGNASANDMRALIRMAQEKTFSAYGFRLEPEVLFVGEF